MRYSIMSFLAASAPFRWLSPLDTLRLSLMQSLHRAHRPELADLIESAHLVVDLPGLWVRPDEATRTWCNESKAVAIEQALLAASTEAGLPFAAIRLLDLPTAPLALTSSPKEPAVPQNPGPCSPAAA